MNKLKPKLFRINTGSCNGCDVEFLATALVDKFQFHKLEVEIAEEISQANLLVITGPLTARSEPFLKSYINKLSEPYVVVGIGTCSITSGIFRDSYAINGPTDKVIDVDINISGCPPRPQSIAEGIAKGVAILNQKVQNVNISKQMDTILQGFEAPKSFRGKINLHANLCTACRTCETVCPSGAINITKIGDKYEHKVWHNTCCFCGNCVFFCPTGAIYNTNDFDTAKHQDEKYSDTNISYIKTDNCSSCNKRYKKPTTGLLKKAYINDDINKLNNNLCPECRKKENFTRMYL